MGWGEKETQKGRGPQPSHAYNNLLHIVCRAMPRRLYRIKPLTTRRVDRIFCVLRSAGLFPADSVEPTVIGPVTTSGLRGVLCGCVSGIDLDLVVKYLAQEAV